MYYDGYKDYILKIDDFVWNRKSNAIKLYRHPYEIWGQMIDPKFFENIFSTCENREKCILIFQLFYRRSKNFVN